MATAAAAADAGAEGKESTWRSFFLSALTLGFKIEHADEAWVYTEEPHTTRRREILRKYPEIKQLMGYDPSIVPIVLAEVAAQVAACVLICVLDPSWPALLLAAYCFGGVLNHSLGSAIHEIGHNLAFGHARPWANRLLSVACNLPLGVPMAISYKKYHTDHHRWLGHDDKDVDIPTALESFLFRRPLTKVLWLLAHPLIHGIRPFVKSPRPVTVWEIVNFAAQLAFDALVFRCCGVKALAYLVAGTMMALGLHPLAGHFISEHYLFAGSQATHSYYGPLNRVLFNVGYHVEHHDFPYIPYHRLPRVREIASEFYEDLPHHTSWLRVLWDFIWEDHMGPKARSIVYNGTPRQKAL